MHERNLKCLVFHIGLGDFTAGAGGALAPCTVGMKKFTFQINVKKKKRLHDFFF